MPKYKYACGTCNYTEDVASTLVQYEHTKKYGRMCASCRSSKMYQEIEPPNLNVGWDNQAAGNHGKYWGTKPIVPLSIPRDDGGLDVIGDVNKI